MGFADVPGFEKHGTESKPSKASDEILQALTHYDKP